MAALGLAVAVAASPSGNAVAMLRLGGATEAGADAARLSVAAANARVTAAAATAAACPEGSVPPSGFSDVSGSTHEHSVDCVVWWGVAYGASATSYVPATEVRRDQMASFLARMILQSGGSLPAASAHSGFADTTGNAHEDSIRRLAAVGVIAGTGDGTYAPAQAVRRDQMATFLVRAYEHRTGETLTAPRDHFADTAGSVHRDNIDKAAEAGFASGTTATTFEPGRVVRRDQMASFIARTLDRVVAQGHATPPSPPSAAIERDEYTEDFTDGWADDWELDPSFRVEAGSLSASGPGRARYRFGDYWRDSTLRLRVLHVGGEVRIHYRVNWQLIDRGYLVRGYEIALNGDELLLRRIDDSFHGRQALVLARAPLARSTGWRSLEVTGTGRRLVVRVDGRSVIDHTDIASDARLEGTIGVDVPAGGRASFDDLEVTAMLYPEQTWARTGGPDGTMVTTIVVDPNDPSNVYAGTGHSGLYVSRDRGETWQQLGHAGGLIKNKVSWVEVAPSDSRVIYLGHLEDGGGSRSGDGGRRWSPIRPGDAGWVNAFAVHPQQARIAYVGIGSSESPWHANDQDGVYLTTDDGATWEQLSLGNHSIFTLGIAPGEPEVVYAGGAGGVWRSDDAGATWSDAGGGLGDELIKSLIVDPVDPLVVYAREHYWSGSLFKTMDGGRSWRRVLDGAQGVVMSPSDRQVLYAATSGRVLRSSDGGASWEEITEQPLPGEVDALAVDPSDPQRIYAGLRGQGLFVSSDGGASWQRPRTPFLGDSSSAVAVHPVDPDIVYVGHGHGYLSRTTDGGRTWEALPRFGVGGTQDVITAIAIRPDRPETMFVANLTGVYLSVDAGRSWELSSAGMGDPRIISLAIDPHDPERMYAGTGSSLQYSVYEGTGLYRSLDGGTSWRRVDGLPDAPVPSISVSLADPDMVYAAVMGRGVYRSRDRGTSWSPGAALANPYAYVVAAHPTHPDVVYAGTLEFYGRGDWADTDGLFRSDDAGESWRAVRANVWVENLVVDPARPEHVYFTEHSERIWHSPDDGRTWELATRGLVASNAHLYTYAMATDPKGTVLYMVNCGMGMYRNLLTEAER